MAERRREILRATINHGKFTKALFDSLMFALILSSKHLAQFHHA